MRQENITPVDIIWGTGRMRQAIVSGESQGFAGTLRATPQRFNTIIVQISPDGACVSCHPLVLRDSSAPATASVKVSPPCGSPTTEPAGSARASLTLDTFVMMAEVSSTVAFCISIRLLW